MLATAVPLYRQLAPGIGEAVAKRTILRKKEDNSWETWGDVADRVARGNSSLIQDENTEQEYQLLKKHLSNADLLMSGRHLQHGDTSQPTKNIEVFTNCSTSASTFVLFYLLLNGSGVGRAYDDDMCLVDWAQYLPDLRVVLDESHPDFNSVTMESVREAKKKYKDATWFEVSDTREGWAKAIEYIETLTFTQNHAWSVIVLDFSKVRGSGAPIMGMQGRPASGPSTLMKAIQNIASIKSSGMKPWESTMWVDHYLAECVLVGGARRSARIAVKIWTDPDILEFITIKRGGFLWSANNSVLVDKEFWKQDTTQKKSIFNAICEASYYDKTGEPGVINQDKLVQNNIGIEDYSSGEYIESLKYHVTNVDTKRYLGALAVSVKNKKYTQIINPCAEISLNMLFGYCVISDIVPYFAPTDDEAEEAFRVATRALIRVNLMDSLYHQETKRTNRIGVGMTGIHEYAWKRFGLTFRDLIDEEKSQEFWDTLSRFKDAVVNEAFIYSLKIGVNTPHTNTTFKPSGSVSKLFSLTEGAHLPAMKEYLRWVQFRTGDPLIQEYQNKDYPVRKLTVYKDTTIVGFPTRPEICRLGMGDRLVTAGEATPAEQYQWIRLLEKYWIHGVNQTEDTGNQVSYTLKYDPTMVSYEEYCEVILKNQSSVRCCAVMPQINDTEYEYIPEESISSGEFQRIDDAINGHHMQEEIDIHTLQCSSGSCPL